MNTKNSSWVLAHGHQRKSLWRRRRLVLWAPRARCHLSPAQWLPKPATSQLPEKRRSLRELWSASRQGTGREGGGLERLVIVKRLDGAGAFGCTWAMDMVDARDEKDQRLRLDHGQRVVWGVPARRRSESPACGTWRFARLEGERLAKRRHHQAALVSDRLSPLGFAWIRLDPLGSAWIRLRPDISMVFFWCLHTATIGRGREI
ncbi:MAG: hypothetical protein JWR26_1366 [Pedosphaera sp.]|nr:hypothetical protein [Pedosphaera sp.]